MTAPTTKDDRIKLTNVRISFPKLLKGQEEQFNNKGDPYYSASFILEKNDPQLQKIRDGIVKATAAKFGADKVEAMLAEFKAKDKLPVHDGDIKASKPYGAAYAGKLYLSARNNARTNPPIPVFDNVIDPATGKAREITAATDAKFPYSGSYVNAFVSFYGYRKDGGVGIGASIAGVQFHKDGERLAGGVSSSADDYDAIPDANVAQAAATGTGAAALF